jgi:hypothetical protein
VEELAAIISELKTERAQAAVDDRRALTALADAVTAESFDAARAAEATGLRASPSSAPGSPTCCGPAGCKCSGRRGRRRMTMLPRASARGSVRIQPHAR